MAMAVLSPVCGKEARGSHSAFCRMCEAKISARVFCVSHDLLVAGFCHVDKTS